MASHVQEDTGQQAHNLCDFSDGSISIACHTSQLASNPGTKQQRNQCDSTPDRDTGKLSTKQRADKRENTGNPNRASRNNLPKGDSQARRTGGRKNSQNQHHTPASRRQHYQKNQRQAMFAETGEAGKFE